MNFKRIVECSAEVHDKKIAYTSQLAHVVSNCYVKDKTIESCLGFTGGSFQDMTRIAGVDEKMWAELFIANADNLTENIQKLIDNLAEVNSAIKSGDKGELCDILRRGRESFTDSKTDSFSKHIEGFKEGEIKTTLLHN
jgi:prephenate dehydrogenase